ncbi:hypothetical protein AURDEDRAFT_161650 [Auricularia subglabra TFB-10046 SS5]|nr:hypothetical protein AURDEDRAFT_161650 [Auricularia subglabra TFB-10046 SS5]
MLDVALLSLPVYLPLSGSLGFMHGCRASKYARLTVHHPRASGNIALLALRFPFTSFRMVHFGSAATF